MKTQHDKIVRTCKIIISFCAAQLKKIEIQMNAAVFSNFIRKSDEVCPKYWEVLCTGTFHLKVPDFENRFVILLGIYRKVCRIY